jgi:hypothetical protein
MKVLHNKSITDWSAQGVGNVRRRDAPNEVPLAVENSNSDSDLERRLDQALQDTFPASDPVSIFICW